MNLYLITIFCSVLLSLCAEKWPSKRSSGEQRTLNLFFVIALIAFLIFISGFRYLNYLHSDENGYRYMVQFAMGEPFPWFKLTFPSEWLFDVLVWISANIFHSDQALILISSIITNTLIILFFAKYARPLWFSVFLYISCGSFVASMNVLRQYLAISLFLWCYPLAKNRRFISYILLVMIASTFHQSALFLIPIYFILSRKHFDFGTCFVVFITILILLNFESTMSFILPNTVYDHYLDDVLGKRYGVKLIRVASTILPCLILLVFHRFFHIRCGLDYSLMHAVLLTTCISIISTQYVFAARMESYFTLLTVLAIIRIPELFSKNGSRTFVAVSMFTLYFIFGAYLHLGVPHYYNVLLHNISGVL